MSQTTNGRLLKLLQERGTIRLETSTGVADFANMLVAHNKRLKALGHGYTLRPWEMNHIFVSDIMENYPTFFLIFARDEDYLGMEFHDVVEMARNFEFLQRTDQQPDLASWRTPAAAFKSSSARPYQVVTTQPHRLINTPASRIVSLPKHKTGFPNLKPSLFCTGCNISGHDLSQCWYAEQPRSRPSAHQMRKIRKAALRRKRHGYWNGHEADEPRRTPAVTSRHEQPQPIVRTGFLMVSPP